MEVRNMKRRWSIFDEMEEMFERMNRLVDSFTPRISLDEDYREPETEIHETDKEIIVTMELPGVDKKDIDLKVTEDQIVVKAEHKEEETEKETYRKIYSNFYKAIRLPERVDPDKVKATYKNGILEVRLTKLEQEKGKRINIE